MLPIPPLPWRDDTVSLLPSNLAGLQLLKEYMAGEIGVEDGELVAASKGLHIYDYAWKLAKLRTMRV